MQTTIDEKHKLETALRETSDKRMYERYLAVAAFMKRVNADPINVIDRLCIRM